MNALDALLQRVSASKLTDPAPDQAQREFIFNAALRAADHGRLRPWRFLIIEGNGRLQLGQLFAEVAAADDPNLSDEALQRYRSLPLRAPLVLVVIARCESHPKVPDVEQILSAGAAAQNMITATYALGLGAIWRTGDVAYHPKIKQGLGLIDSERIIGYLYLGTPSAPLGAAPRLNYLDFFAQWPPQ